MFHLQRDICAQIKNFRNNSRPLKGASVVKINSCESYSSTSAARIRAWDIQESLACRQQVRILRIVRQGHPPAFDSGQQRAPKRECPPGASVRAGQ